MDVRAAMSGKKLYSPGEAYRILHDGLRMLPYFRKARAAKAISDAFSERLMLAVTEVNGCALCSYAHAQMALESGMGEPEIENMLAGELGDAPHAELPAILFAQAYADSRGKPSKAAWGKVVETYGDEAAAAILSSIRIIMIGNTYGIPFGSLKSRVSRKKDTRDARSSLGYELVMLLTLIPFLVVALPHAALSNLTKQSLIG